MECETSEPSANRGSCKVLKVLSSNFDPGLPSEEAISARLVVDLALATMRSGERDRCSVENALLCAGRGIMLDREKKL